MDTIQIRYEGHVPSVVGCGVSGEVGTCRVQFTFDEVWEAYPERTAMFVSRFGALAVLLDGTDGCVVPATLVPKGDDLVHVSAFGVGRAETGATLRYNGEPVRVTFYAGGATAKILDPAELTSYERLLARLNETEAALGPAILTAEDAANEATAAAAAAYDAAQDATIAAAEAREHFTTTSARPAERTLLYTVTVPAGTTAIGGLDEACDGLVPCAPGHRLRVETVVGTTQAEPVRLGVRLTQTDEAGAAIRSQIVRGDGTVTLSCAARAVRLELTSEAVSGELTPGFVVLRGSVALTDLDFAGPVTSLDGRIVLPQLEDAGGLPDYWLEPLAAAAERVRAAQAAAGETGESFLFFTGARWKASAQHSPRLIRALRSRCGRMPVLCAGDWIGDAADRTDAQALLSDAVRAFGAFAPVDSVAGANDRALLTDGELEARLFYPQRGRTWRPAPGVWLSRAGGRLVFAGVDASRPFAEAEEALTAAAELLPAGCRLILVTNEPAAELLTWCDAHPIAAAVFAGRANADSVTRTQGGVPVIRSLDDGRGTLKTANEHALDVVTVDPAGNELRLVRLGCGADRTVTMR